MALPRYYTVRHVAEIFNRDENTIRRWITEGRRVVFRGVEYVPEKDPGKNWLFYTISVEVPEK